MGVNIAEKKLTLKTVFPFRLDLTSWALRRRKNNIVDRWNGHRYTRVLILGGWPAKVSVAQEGPASEPGLEVSLRGEQEGIGPIGDDAMRAMQRMLRPGLDLRPFYALAENDGYIGPLVRRFSGVKPPRFPTVFEALVNSIACQQVSLDIGIILLNRLAEKFGPAYHDGAPMYAFPGPEDLADAPEEEMRKLGFSYRKIQYIKELAAGVASNRIDLAGLEDMTGREVAGYLQEIRGIGRWSAEYVLLRGLGRLDMFPGDDVGAQNNLRKLFHLDHRPGYEEIKELTSRWHPYEGLVYFHLLLNKLYLSGVL